MWLAGLLTFGLTVAAMVALRPFAFVVDLIDRPGGHKTHHGAVPVVGGLAMFLGLVFGLGAMPGGLGSFQYFLMSAAVLVVTGLLDDRFSLSPWVRLVIQVAAVMPMMFGAGIRVDDLGGVFGPGPLPLGDLAAPMTVLVAVAAINAFNMLDGLDGLAGAMALVALTVLVVTFGQHGDFGPAFVLVALCGAVLGFLLFNLPVHANRSVRCFMGDAGSTLLGFSVAWFAIEASQPPRGFLPGGTVLWIVAIPAYDLIWTLVRRVSRGQSPFRADNEHLHHSLLKAGLGVRAVFAVLVTMALVLGCIGLGGRALGVHPAAMLALWFACGAIVVLFCRHARFLADLIPKDYRRLDGEQTLAGTPVPAVEPRRREF